MTFKDIFPGLSRTKVIFQDFPGPGIFKKKIQDFPGGVGTLNKKLAEKAATKIALVTIKYTGTRSYVTRPRRSGRPCRVIDSLSRPILGVSASFDSRLYNNSSVTDLNRTTALTSCTRPPFKKAVNISPMEEFTYDIASIYLPFPTALIKFKQPARLNYTWRTH